MNHLDEAPAVPPEDEGGDERAGQVAAGVVLMVLGWGLAVAANLLLHATAPSGGTVVGPLTIPHAVGALAWATVIIGLGTGAVGLAMLAIARSAPRGPLVLPGYQY